ncbi:MAG: amidohydrolase family protein [Bacteroidota bacterium]
MQQAFVKEGKTEPRYHALSRPAHTEADSVGKVMDLVRTTGCKTYIVHSSTAGAIEHIRKAKAEGLPVYGETCPQYLLLEDSAYEKPSIEALKYVISPPLRKKADQQALWEGIADGTIDTLATDHCPFNTHGQKDRGLNNFTRIPNGAGGIEFRMALLYTYGVLAKRITMQQFVALTSSNAARIFGLFPQKGSIEVGSDADLVLWNPDSASVISAQHQQQRCDSNIYEGFEIKGKAEMVIQKGIVIYKNRTFIEN